MIHVQRLTASVACETTALTCDVPANGTIDSTINTDLYRSTAATGELVQITVDETTTSVPSVEWRLLDKNGVPVAPIHFFTGSDALDTQALSATLSPYQIELRDGGFDQTRPYRVHIQRLTTSAAARTTPSPATPPSPVRSVTR